MFATCRCHTDKYDKLYKSGQFTSNFTAVYDLMTEIGLLPVSYDKTSYNYINYDIGNKAWYFMNMTAEENELVMRLYLTLATNPGQLSLLLEFVRQLPVVTAVSQFPALGAITSVRAATRNGTNWHADR